MTNPFDLTGQTALVTGGNGGIGLGMAEALARAGADVCIWGRNREKNEAAENTLKQHGRKVLSLICDVSDEARVEECFGETVDRLGPVTACFANAGMHQMTTRFHEMTADEWRRIFKVNMEGSFFTFRAAVRHMLDHGQGGSLVATSSLSAVSAMAKGEHYAATKAGLLAMVRSIAVEYARFGIRANAVLPGWVESEMTGDVLSWDKFVDAVKPRIPMKRWGRPDDYGPIAVYFASKASSYHTGDIVIIDGAYHCF